MTIVLEYYADELLEKRIPINESGQPMFDWGEMIPGQTKEKTYYIKNVTNDTITLRQPYTNDEDFKIKNFPTRLKGLEAGMLELEFSPPINRTKPLNSSFGFDKIIG